MSQITLNLIAITIFTLVMSSLLGPLLQISPVVPAVAVAGILGLAALDTLSWRGQAGTLLVNWFANFSAEHRSRVIHHEAGHFLAAHLLNIPITGYTLTAWDAFRQGQIGQGGVSFDCQELDQELAQNNLSAQLLNRYATVWMAGGAAERLVYGNVAGGADDRQKFSTLWMQLQSPPLACDTKQRWADLQARTLLQDHWSAYEALVDAMQQRLPVADCCVLVDQRRLAAVPEKSQA